MIFDLFDEIRFDDTAIFTIIVTLNFNYVSQSFFFISVHLFRCLLSDMEGPRRIFLLSPVNYTCTISCVYIYNIYYMWRVHICKKKKIQHQCC